MKRFRRHSHRQALIDACRLTGYTIAPASSDYGPYRTEKFQYIVFNAAGNVLRDYGTSLRSPVRTFRFMWQAAAAALEDQGVDVDALKPPRDTLRKNGNCTSAA